MAVPAAAAGPRLGRVTAFDARRGLGTVTAVDGAPYGFHASAIADGSRCIDEGATVTFVVVPGNGGREEARSLVAVPDQAALSVHT
jgi:cold shock CspA family protein